jgi:LPS sulfotransferase NodH
MTTKWGRQELLGPFYRWTRVHPPTQFFIICRARTGSNLLVWLLDSHSKIRPLTEPFGPYDLRKTWIQNQILDHGLIAYLEHQLQPKANEAAVGFKVLYDQLEASYGHQWGLQDLPEVLTFLRQRQDFKIIHLKRRNKLKSLVSSKIAEINQTYILFNRRKRDNNIQIELTPAECEAELNQTAACEQRYDHFFAHHDVLEVFYEELTTNTAAESKRILDFLGLEYRPLKAMTIKQNVRPLSQIIKNYEALKQHFADTPRANLFED